MLSSELQAACGSHCGNLRADSLWNLGSPLTGLLDKWKWSDSGLLGDWNLIQALRQSQGPSPKAVRQWQILLGYSIGIA